MGDNLDVATSEDDEQIDDNLGDESKPVPFKYSITSYGADYLVDGLVRRIEDGSIYVPSFQRGFVWGFGQASRFVESLLLGLPVPGIFLSKEQDTQKLLVIDGQQRLRTLQYFYGGIFAPTGQEFALRDVQSQFSGATYKSLQDQDRLRLDDSILHATIVKQDEPSEDDSSIYHIFERLNTGGTQLHPQEVRASIYHGEFNDLLKSLNDNKHWRAVYGPVSRRMRDQELILRFLALYYRGDHYEKPMKGFLNKYMGKNRHLLLQSENQLSDVFLTTVQAVYECLGSKAFKPKKAINAAVLDAVMVGVARRLEHGPITDGNTMRAKYDGLVVRKPFVAATETGTAREESVSRRLKLSSQAFANVQ